MDEAKTSLLQLVSRDMTAISKAKTGLFRKSAATNLLLEEQRLLDDFLQQNQTIYTFGIYALLTPYYIDLCTALVKRRILSEEWNTHASKQHHLLVFGVLRVLTRDIELQRLVVRLRALSVIITLIKSFIDQMHSNENQLSTIDIRLLIELVSIIKHLSSDKKLRSHIFPMTGSLTLLLSSENPQLTLTILATMLNLASSRSTFLKQISSINILEPLMDLLASPTCRTLVLELFGHILQIPTIVDDFIQCHGTTQLLEMLPVPSPPELSISKDDLIACIQLLGCLSTDTVLATEIRTDKCVRLLLNHINIDHPDSELDAIVCGALSQLALDSRKSTLLFCYILISKKKL